MFQIALVPHEQDGNVGAIIFAESFDPLLQVDIGGAIGDVIYEHGACSPAAISETEESLRADGVRGCGNRPHSDVIP